MAGAAVVLGGVLTWPFTVDDAYIVARYAGRLAAGEGWTFQPGPPTDGVTGPLWVLPASVAALLGLSPILLQKALGMLCVALSAAVAVRQMRGRARGRRAAWIAAAVLSVQGNLAVWGGAGLETGVATLLFTALALTSSSIRRGLAAACLAGLRPELAPAVVVVLAFRRDRRAFGIALAGAMLLVAWRSATFGALLPLSFWAKGASVGTGIAYVAFGLLVTTGAGGVLLAIQSRQRALQAALATQLATIALLGGDWMPGFRLLVPLLPVYAVLVADGSVRLFVRQTRRARRPEGNLLGWGLAGLLIASALALPLLDFAVQVRPIRAAGEARENAAPLARRLAERASVALVDVGFLVHEGPDDVLDLGGLTDPIIARSPGGHVAKQFPIAYLAARGPEVILLHSRAQPLVVDGALRTLAGHPVERRLAASSYVREMYEVREVIRYAPDYFYVWLERRPTSP
ncbi:MAG: hypothetical protein AAGE52_11080 [Myxococcota bacterium]